MSDIGKMMRPKRFSIKEKGKIILLVETYTGSRLELHLENVSLHGIGGVLKGKLPPEEGLEIGNLVPASKISGGENEVTLGRLVVRRIIQSEEKNETFIAFSTVDSRVPIDGFLSRYLDTTLDASKGSYDYELSPSKFSLRNFREMNRSNVDLFAHAEQFEVYYQEFVESPKNQFGNIRLPSKGERVKLRQRRRGSRNDFLVMASNDYLGLASSEEVCESAKKAIDQYGFGSTGSPLISGLTEIHEELSDFIAKLLHREKAILFNSGYAANVGAVPALTGVQDLLIADMLCHASLLDGMQMSKGTSRFFKHNNVKHLEKLLKENRDEHVGSLVITEGVFSMDGDAPPLTEITKIAKAHNSRVFLDEAHSLGVIGPNGMGCAAKHPDAKVDVIMGTFSKIAGAIGGFIAADKEVIHWLNFSARSLMFSVSIPPSTAAAALTALKIFRNNPELVNRLQANIKHFVMGLRELGFTIDPNHESAVVPVVIGNDETVGKMNQVFWENGIYVVPVGYPVVARNQSRFRFTMMSTHTISDLDFVLSILEKAMEKVGFEPRKDEDKSDAA